jgi:tetratricopeptide (TPR) repeat protein
MRCLAAALLLCLVPAARAADEKPKGPLAEARQRWLKGGYAEARELYEEKAKDEKFRTAATVGIARTFVSEGEHARALEVLDAALKDAEENPDLLAARADALYQTGDWDKALETAEAALKAKEEHFAARWVRARVYRDRGENKEADAEMRWFVRTYTRRSNADDDIKDPDELLIVGQAGAENARWHNLPQQFKFILDEVYADVLKFEPDCWYAELYAGDMLLEKGNKPEAVAAFDKALKLNPRAAEALVGKGRAALQRYEIADAETFAEKALKINPRLTPALRLRADGHLIAGDFAAAVKLLEKARAVNPREEATLARLAACYHFRRDKDAFTATEAAAKGFNPKPGVFYHDLANALEERKYYAEAEKYFRTSIDFDDKLAAPKSSLGLLYLRLGREKEGRELLEKAFDADRYNVRVANSLKVLRHLDKYATKESEHYVLRYDPKTDAVLAEFVLEFLEEVHAKLAKDFNFEPQGKVLFELFNNHEMFSGRTVALPDLHTIGACTGRVVTMVSPGGQGLARKFNWGRVVRHELVHIFNLAQTDFQVPHWLTEGLAVRNEGGGKPPSWDAILRERFAKDDLLNLDTIQLGFIRPRNQDEWALAYYQSLLYVEYLIKAHGLPAVGQMLDAYREGMSTAAAVERVCKVEKADFEKGYRAYVAALVKAIPAPRKKEKARTFAELQKAREEKPEDPDTAAALAGEYLKRKRSADARKLVDAVLEKQPTHPAACVVKARLLAAAGEDAEARKLVEAAVAADGSDVRLRAFLARLCLESKEYAAAAEQYEECRKLAPLDGDWLDQLREIYTKTDDKEKLTGALRAAILADPDDFKARLELAKLCTAAKDYAGAEAAARDALQIDVLDPEARKLLLAALKEQGKDAEAEKLSGRFGKE